MSYFDKDTLSAKQDAARAKALAASKRKRPATDPPDTPPYSPTEHKLGGSRLVHGVINTDVETYEQRKHVIREEIARLIGMEMLKHGMIHFEVTRRDIVKGFWECRVEGIAVVRGKPEPIDWGSGPDGRY